MRLPIVALTEGNVLLFGSVAAAENYIEPVDLDDYEVYDGEGSLLRATPRPGVVAVRLEVESGDEIHRLGLRAELIRFLVANPQLGRADESIFGLDLGDLIETVEEAVGYTR